MKVTDQLRDLRELDSDELDARLKQSRRELYELRFKLAVGQLENNREIHKVRKDIARILTVIHQQRLEMAPVGAGLAPPAEGAAEEEVAVATEEESE
ncbi:MAG TPA: 50S ribosomal protein L29 [Candidatus Dormibacteraeota bacterium]